MNNKKLNVLLIGYNRPAFMKSQLEFFESLDDICLDIFFAIDGPSNAMHLQNIEKNREIILKSKFYKPERTLFSESNHGCRDGVKLAINWFFENVTRGVIIEDDCVVNRSSIDYFNFYLQEKYISDPKFCQINGSLPHPENEQTVLSKTVNLKAAKTDLPFIWGWATTKSAWERYQTSVSYKLFDLLHLILKMKNLSYPVYIYYLSSLVKRGELDTWDIDWVWINLINGNYSISPPKNFVKNIGFGDGGTNNVTTENRLSIDLPIIKNYKFTNELLPRNRQRELLQMETVSPRKLTTIIKMFVSAFIFHQWKNTPNA